MEINDKIPYIVVRIDLACCKRCFPNLRKILMKNEDIYKVDVDREKKRICVRSTLHPFLVLKEIARSGKSAELIFYDKEPIIVDRQHKNAKNSRENQSHQPNQTAEEPKQDTREHDEGKFTFCSDDLREKKEENASKDLREKKEEIASKDLREKKEENASKDLHEKKEEDANNGDEKHCEQNLQQNHAGKNLCPKPEVRGESDESRMRIARRNAGVKSCECRECYYRCNCKGEQVQDESGDDHCSRNSTGNGRDRDHYHCQNYDFPTREKHPAHEKKVLENEGFHNSAFHNKGYDDDRGRHDFRGSGREDHYRCHNDDIPLRKKSSSHEKKISQDDDAFNGEGFDDHYRRNLRGNGREGHHRCRRNYDSPPRKKDSAHENYHYKHNLRGNGREDHYRCRNYDGPPRKNDSDSAHEKKISKPKNSYDDAVFEDDEGSDDRFRHHSRGNGRENDHYSRRNYDDTRKRDSDHEKKTPKTDHLFNPAFDDYCRPRNDGWFRRVDETMFFNDNYLDHFDSRIPPSYDHYGFPSLPPPPPPYEHCGFYSIPTHPPPPPPPPPPPSLYFSSFSNDDPSSCAIM